MEESIILRYRKLNASFKRELIYHVGVDAGFFTEYTYMLNAMLWCLQHKIQFKLFSDDANFSYNEGWGDYFEPFCVEVHETFHRRYNKHCLPSWRKLLKRKDLGILKWKLKCSFLNVIGDFLALRYYHKRVLLNHHVCFDPNCHFCIPELNMNGDYFHAFRILVDITWRMNAQTKQEGIRIQKGLNLPKNYMGCQIRGGDKIVETELLSPEFYVKLIENKYHGNDVFVLTDDIQIFKELQLKSPNVNWYTLCSEDENGYVNSAFSQSRGGRKRNQMVRFLISIEILMHSSLFVGSITPGPSLFLLKWGYPHNRPVDCLFEQLKEVVSLPIAQRSRVAEEFLKKT